MMILKKYTCLLIGVFLFGNVCGQEKGDTYGIKYDIVIRGGQKKRVVGGDTEISDELPKPIQAKDTAIKDPYSPKALTYIGPSYENAYRPLKTLNTFILGAGSSNMYDTYLSPLRYSGFNIQLIYEQMRETTWFDSKFRKQQIIELEFASGQNTMKSVREYWGKLRYQLGGHYSFYENRGLMLSAGGFWDITAGGLYNERNGNNPATGRAYTNLNLSVMASYKWKKYAIRWQVDMPFMGMLFSPKYGQSYYEISLGNTVGIVNFASFHNQRALRNFVTVDIPISSYIVRVGYLGDWYQTKVNSIQTHHYTHSFVLGFPLEGVKKVRQKTHNTYWD